MPGYTASLPDWIANVQVARDPGPWQSTKVHEVFQDAFLPTALVIGKAICQMRLAREIWVTGHSPGGALAVLLAATLVENGIPVAGLYTFAAPRVGHEAFFAEQLNGSLAGKAALVGQLGTPTKVVSHGPYARTHTGGWDMVCHGPTATAPRDVLRICNANAVYDVATAGLNAGRPNQRRPRWKRCPDPGRLRSPSAQQAAWAPRWTQTLPSPGS